MVTLEERMRVLEILKEGKISPEAAAQLLEAMDAEPPQPYAPPPPVSPAAPSAFASPPSEPGQKARFLRVKVTDTGTGRPRVNVRIPVSLVNLGLKLGARYAPEVEGLDMAQMLQAVQAGEQGPLVDVYDHDDGEHVEVFLE